MKQKHSLNFLIGLTIGSLLALLFWYWQKSTSAEDGALKLLDRLAETEKRVRNLKAEINAGTPPSLGRDRIEESAPPDPTPAADEPVAETEPAPAEDLTAIKGVGPVFQQRLYAQGIKTIAAVGALSADRLAEVLQIAPGRAERILAAVS